jgi:hypothetical protein
MTPVVHDVKVYAKEIKQTGLLEQSFGKKTKTYARAGVVVTVVGPRKGFKKKFTIKRTINGKEVLYEEYRNPVSYAHLVEKGTEPHSLGSGTEGRKGIDKGGGHHPGAKANPILQRAFWRNQRVILGIYRAELAEGVERVATEMAVK